MCLAYTIKKFEFWRPRLRGTPHWSTPKFCQILSLLHIYLFRKFHQFSVSRYSLNMTSLFEHPQILSFLHISQH